MSQENVEIVRAGLEAAFRRPKPDFATLNSLYHPAHELVSRREALEGGSQLGARGFRAWLAEENLLWESRLEEVTKIDDDRVLAITPTRNTGTSTGIEVETRFACIVTVRGGK